MPLREHGPSGWCDGEHVAMSEVSRSSFDGMGRSTGLSHVPVIQVVDAQAARDLCVMDPVACSGKRDNITNIHVIEHVVGGLQAL